ncbi:hypothetical protein [Streptomyces cavernicola]|uniref:Secreted protein n=1 Tax=Streptomyces cavernicola TaxID=3043613 RepID=A0ABT6SDE0_9ACTN|nr:hypothetical protein [Streptomyces sp. B-S-A6]MDI3405488.1 hypothetical protein [Streptomyces sp. B-S-A6]
MTAAAAIPAAQRMARSAGGRRALRVGLFLGALLALGLLFGGRAQAAEAVDAPQASRTVSSTEGSATSTRGGFESASASATSTAGPSEWAGSSEPTEADPTAESEPEPGYESAFKPASEPGATAAFKPASKPTATSASEPVSDSDSEADSEFGPRAALRHTVRAAVDSTSAAGVTATSVATSTTTSTAVSLTRYVTGELTRTVANPLGLLAEEAARRLPESPFPRPSLPEFGEIGPGGDATQPVPDRVVPQEREHGARADDGAAHKVRSAFACQRWDRFGGNVAAGQAHDAAGRDARQQPQLPSDDPQGPYGIAGQSASDGGAQRHGELHATTVTGVPPFRLVAGEGAATAYHPTRDRHRDILEFPG